MRRCFLFILIFMGCSTSGFAITIFDNIPYKSFDDSPFKNQNFEYFNLEDFESGALNAPGVNFGGADSGNGLLGTPLELVVSNQFASVDGDDGDPTNGTCVNCFAAQINDEGSVGLIDFYAYYLTGNLPTHVGFVITDKAEKSIYGILPYNEIGDPLDFHELPELTFGAGSDDDRFFGVYYPKGITFITFYFAPEAGKPNVGFVVDHLQYGRASATPEPSTILLFGAGILGLAVGRKRMFR